MEHLTNSCSYSETLWKNHEKIFSVSNKDQISMKETMDKSRRKPYQNPILNHSWWLSLGFVLWAVWKERNKIIFKGKERTTIELRRMIVQNITETILV